MILSPTKRRSTTLQRLKLLMQVHWWNLKPFQKGISGWFFIGALTIFLSGCAYQTGGFAVTEILTPEPATVQPSATAIAQNQPIHITLHPTLTATALPSLQPSSTPIPQSEICSPLVSAKRSELIEIVSDGFHPPPPGQDGRHQGVDFAYYRKFGRASIAGDGFQAVLDGKVAALIVDRFPYGNALIIETPPLLVPSWVRENIQLAQGESLYVLYAHLAEFYPTEIGETVSSCQLIGVVGNSGDAGVAHLHLEVRVGEEGQILSSMAYYVATATPEERQAYLRWRTSGEFRAIDPMTIFVENGG